MLEGLLLLCATVPFQYHVIRLTLLVTVSLVNVVTVDACDFVIARIQDKLCG